MSFDLAFKSEPPLPPSARGANMLDAARQTLPGLCLAGGIAVMAFALRLIPGVSFLSPLILAIILGTGFHNLIGTPVAAKTGVKFTLKRILRFAIILLGLQLTLQQIGEVGLMGVAVIVTTLTATFLFTKWLGAAIGVDRKLAELIAAGTSICGASAVIAVNTVTEGHDEDVAYAIACVTVFGSLAMFIYPALPAILHMTPRTFGLWTGTSIHEIAQVVAAAFQAGKQAGDYATIAKLTRVAMLAPVVVTLGLLATRQHKARTNTQARRKAPMPYFVLGFIAVVILNSTVAVPPITKHELIMLTTFLLSMSLAAMGLETDIAKLLAKGLRPLLLGAASWMFIAGFSLMLIKLIF